MDRIEVVLSFYKATKNKHVYQGEEFAPIQSLYLDKHVTGDSPPPRVQVTVEAV